MAKQSGQERVEEMVGVLREWQGIERVAMNDTAEIMEKTDNSLIRMIMEIIRHDSLMHHRVQQFLIDAVTRQDVTATREEVAAIWDGIEEHDKHEKQTIAMAEKLQAKAWNPIHKELLGYLLTDEKKHDGLMGVLNAIKQGMNRASGG